MKKGQITVFIILGILVVGLIIMGVYFRSEIVKGLKRVQILEEVIMPGEIKNIEDYVKECIKINSEEAIDLIGMRGGYIDFPMEEFSSPVNPFGNNLKYGGETVYWYYKTSNGLDKFQKPSLKDMESSLENYISNNIENCLDFRDFNFGIIKGNKEVDVKINDNNVDVILEMPLRLSVDDKNYGIDSFNVRIEKPLGRLYKEASGIFELENSELFMEERTLDMMAMYEEVPYSGVDFKCVSRIWSKQEVIDNLKKILELNIPDYNFGEGEKMLKMGEVSKDIGVDFIYSGEWPFMLSTKPDEEVLKGQSYNEGILGSILMSFFCLNQYHFVYDIKYPVLVSLSKDGYVFNFANLVVIENNQGRVNRFLDEKQEVENKICGNKLGKIKVYSNVRDAKVSLKCSRIICELGRTSLHDDGVYYDGSSVQCVNGEIIVEKEGYTQGKISVGLNEDVMIFLKPVKEIGFSVNVGRDLISGENAIVFLEGYDYSAVAYYPSQDKIKLAEGNYKVRVYVIKGGEGIKVKGKTIENCVDVPREGALGYLGFNEEKCSTIKLDDVEVNQFIVGGGEFDIYIGKEDLEREKMVLRLQSIGMPKDIDELAKMYDKVRGLEGDVYFE